MKKFYLVALAFFILFLTGCASSTKDIQIDTAIDPKVKLSGYKTYTWLGAAGVLNDPEQKWQPPNFDVAGDVKYLIDREMEKRDISKSTDPENADLAVGFVIGIDMANLKLKKDPETKVEMLKNVPGGALVVVFIDNATGFVIWVGQATADVRVDASDEEVRDRLDYAVSQMFKQMPKD